MRNTIITAPTRENWGILLHGQRLGFQSLYKLSGRKINPFSLDVMCQDKNCPLTKAQIINIEKGRTDFRYSTLYNYITYLNYLNETFLLR
jgi:hypothetical protein